MTEQFSEKVEILKDGANIMITLDGLTGDISAGGDGQDGDLILKDGAGNERIHVDAQLGMISVKASDSSEVVRITGGDGNPGSIALRHSDGTSRVLFNAANGRGLFGGGGAAGLVACHPPSTTNINDMSQASIRLNGANGDLDLGGNGVDGDLRLRDTDGTIRMHFDGAGANCWIGSNGEDGDFCMYPSGATRMYTHSQASVRLDGGSGSCWIGGGGTNGNIFLKGDDGTTRISFAASSGDAVLGGHGSEGDLLLKNSDGKVRLHFDAGGGNAWIGGSGADGDLCLFPPTATSINSTGQASVRLDGGAGNAYLGGNGTIGDLYLRNDSGATRMYFTATNGDVSVGGNGVHGSMMLKRTDGVICMRASAASGDMELGGGGVDGDLRLKNTDGTLRMHLDAGGGNAMFGGNGADGDLLLFPSGATSLSDWSQATIHLDAQSGDILLRNADCAEDFDIHHLDEAVAEPGSVMVIDEEGHLRVSSKSYDKCVAGVISGAGDYKPGIVLDKQPELVNRRPLALVGKVYCKVDADLGAIEVGDLLTTSSTAGHAMKAQDPMRAFGAVIGKALQPLPSGKGLVPILVALQ